MNIRASNWLFTYLDENNEKHMIAAKFSDEEIAEMQIKYPKVKWLDKILL